MILVDKGHIACKGDRSTLLAELGVVMKTLIEKGVVDKGDLEDVVITCTMSEKELKERMMKMLERALSGNEEED